MTSLPQYTSLTSCGFKSGSGFFDASRSLEGSQAGYAGGKAGLPTFALRPEPQHHFSRLFHMRDVFAAGWFYPHRDRLGEPQVGHRAEDN